MPTSVRALTPEQILWYARLCTISASSIIIYDQLLTVGDEVRLIWRSRWSAGKVLFLVVRYYNVATVISVFFNCLRENMYASDGVLTILLRLIVLPVGFAWLRWQATSGIVVYCLTEIILMLRLYAMYSSARWVLIVLTSCFACVVVSEAVILALSTKSQLGEITSSSIDMSSCILADTWSLSFLYWIPFLGFEALLFALSLIKGIISIRDKNAFSDVFSVTSNTDYLSVLKIVVPTRALKAIEVLIRDSVLYFVLIFTVFLANAIAWIVDSGRIGEIPVALAVALSTTMAQRLLLNIRANFDRRQHGGEDADEDDTDGMQTGGGTDTFAFSDRSLVGMSSMVASTGPVYGIEDIDVERQRGEDVERGESGRRRDKGKTVCRGDSEQGCRAPLDMSIIHIQTTNSQLSGSTAAISPFCAFSEQVEGPCESCVAEASTAGPSRTSREKTSPTSSHRTF